MTKGKIMEDFKPLKEPFNIVVFCGGYGTRMWPMSRKAYPKQFQPLLGKKSFFRTALERVHRGFSWENIFVSTSIDQVNYIKEQGEEIPIKNIIAEPERRDTLGAVAYTIAYVDYYFPDSILGIIWGADHLVKDEDKFIRLMQSAAGICSKKDVICKIDSPPGYPSTANGWVGAGEVIGKVDSFDVKEFKGFIEKPNTEKAQELFRDKNNFINTGYFVGRTTVMLDLFSKNSPDCYEKIMKIKKAIGTDDHQKVLAEQYALIDKISLDYGFFEKLPKESMMVIPTDFGWYDVGTWDLLFESLSKDLKDNVTNGTVDINGSTGNVVYLPDGKIASIINVENLIIVDTNDALLVCKRGDSGEVKKLVEKLKEQGKGEYL